MCWWFRGKWRDCRASGRGSAGDRDRERANKSALGAEWKVASVRFDCFFFFWSRGIEINFSRAPQFSRSALDFHSFSCSPEVHATAQSASTRRAKAERIASYLFEAGFISNCELLVLFDFAVFRKNRRKAETGEKNERARSILSLFPLSFPSLFAFSPPSLFFPEDRP